MNKEVNEKKKRYAIIISFLVLMVCITGGTYAYFALTASNNSVTGSVGGASLNLTVTKVYPTSEHNNKNMIPQLESTLDEAISLEHKCVDGNGNVICQVYQATVTNVGSTTSVLNGMISFTGIENMPNLKWMRINDSNTLGTYSSSLASTDKALFEEERSFGANTSNTYYFVFWIDETGEVQTDNGTFRANIEFDSSTGGLTSTVRPNTLLLSDYIISLYNDGSSITNTTVGDGPQIVSLNNVQRIMKVEQGTINGVDYGVEYRYYGNDTEEDTANGKYLTKNYVDFNGELWRIISVSKVFSSESDTTGETRVRIIKDTPIGNYAWDSDDDYNNNWADATLMCQLNTMYYNDSIQACSSKTLTSLDTSLNAEARSLIDNALWYLSGGNTPDLYANDYYTIERGTTVADSSYPYIWTGKVGIMYPSDYAYAADLSKCKVTAYEYNSYTTNCLNTDWLFNSNYQWLISPFTEDSYYAWIVFGSGYLYYDADSSVDVQRGVRPLAILKSDVTKLEGEGTSGNPYKIGLSE